MTEGEKMVWAAVFAQAYDVSNPPAHVVMDKGDAWEKWELDQATSAAEMATGVVLRMGACLNRVYEGFGPESDVAEHLEEMLGMCEKDE